MAILTYADVKDKASTLRAMTSLDREEFEALAVGLGAVWNHLEEQAGREASTGGRPPPLRAIEEELLFILCSTGRVTPSRKGGGMCLGSVRGKRMAGVTAGVGYGRRRSSARVMGRRGGRRSCGRGWKKRRGKRLGWTGRHGGSTARRTTSVNGSTTAVKKAHTVKNTRVAGLEDRQIKYVSETPEGKKHDKKSCDEDGIRTPPGSSLYRDSGFQGHAIEGVAIYQPKKKPRGGELSADAKAHHRLISSVRLGVEQVIAGVKRCRIVKDVFRNTQEDYADTVMELACGLHNFRNHCRLEAY